jgi:hypothetical protein
MADGRIRGGGANSYEGAVSIGLFQYPTPFTWKTRTKVVASKLQ